MPVTGRLAERGAGRGGTAACSPLSPLPACPGALWLTHDDPQLLVAEEMAERVLRRVRRGETVVDLSVDLAQPRLVGAAAGLAVLP